MLKLLTAGVIALALASAMSAQASGLDREDVGKLLIGVVALAAIGVAVDNNNRREEESRATLQPAHGISTGNSWSHRNDQRHDSRRRVLPHDCLRRVETRFGTQRMFGQHCLQRNYAHVNNLPERCAVRVYTINGPRSGFDPLCLREQGFQSNRRH